MKKLLTFVYLVFFMISTFQSGIIYAAESVSLEDKKEKNVKVLDAVENVVDNAIEKIDEKTSNKKVEAKLEKKEQEIEKYIEEAKEKIEEGKSEEEMKDEYINLKKYIKEYLNQEEVQEYLKLKLMQKDTIGAFDGLKIGKIYDKGWSEEEQMKKIEEVNREYGEEVLVWE